MRAHPKLVILRILINEASRQTIPHGTGKMTRHGLIQKDAKTSGVLDNKQNNNQQP
jgi:hypothetical protein